MALSIGYRISELHNRLRDHGVSYDDVVALRRISMTLSRWSELECGTDGGCIERDEKTGIPYWYNARAYDVQANDRRAYSRIPDRERGALKRLAAIMARYPHLKAYHQTDPRGAALYILRPGDYADGAPIDSVYNRGVAVAS